MLGGALFAGGVKIQPAEVATLSIVHWAVGETQSGYPATVGGYTRNPNNTAYDWETLFHFTPEDLPKTLDSVKLHVSFSSVDIGPVARSLNLYEQDKIANWNSSLIDYNTFNDGAYTSSSWEKLIEENLIANNTQVITYKSQNLKSLVQGWIDSPSSASKGLVLATNYYHYAYMTKISSIELELFSSDWDGNQIPDETEEIHKDLRTQDNDVFIPQNKWTSETATQTSTTIELYFSTIPEFKRLGKVSYTVPAGAVEDENLPALIFAKKNTNFSNDIDYSAFRVMKKKAGSVAYSQPIPVEDKFKDVPLERWVVKGWDESLARWREIPVESLEDGVLWVEAPPAVELIQAAPRDYVMIDHQTGLHPTFTFVDELGEQNTVKFKYDFSMGATEISIGLYNDIMLKYYPDDFSPIVGSRDLPAYGIGFSHAILFCNAMSKENGLTPFYDFKDENITWIQGEYSDLPPFIDDLDMHWGENGYRLPFEWEWMVTASNFSWGTYSVARITTSQDYKYPWGEQFSDLNHSVAKWSVGNSEPLIQLKPTGYSSQRSENIFGRHVKIGYDLIGNVAEWTMSDYYLNYLKDEQGGGDFVPPSAQVGCNENCKPQMGIFERVVLKGGSVRNYNVAGSVRDPSLYNTELSRNYREMANVVYPSTAYEKWREDLKFSGFRVAKGGFSYVGKDIDKDGLPDKYEGREYSASDGSTVDLSLATVGVRDIYYQPLTTSDLERDVDVIGPGGKIFKNLNLAYPRHGAMDTLIKSFARAPVVDYASGGIKMHVVKDNGKFRSCSMSQSEYFTIGVSTSNLEKMGCISKAEEDVYYQAFFVDKIRGNKALDGTATFNSNAGNIIGLASMAKNMGYYEDGGQWFPDQNYLGFVDKDNVGWSLEKKIEVKQAYTAMHELGHNFGLMSLESSDMTVWEPTSVMPYYNKMRGIDYYREDDSRKDIYLDFGRGGLTNLDLSKIDANFKLDYDPTIIPGTIIKGIYCGYDGKTKTKHFGTVSSPLLGSEMWCENNDDSDLSKCVQPHFYKAIEFIGGESCSLPESIDDRTLAEIFKKPDGQWSQVTLWPYYENKYHGTDNPSPKQ